MNFLFVYNRQQTASATRSNNLTTTRNVGTDAARGQQQPTRNVGQQDMRKDGSGLVAQSGLTAEQKKAVREEWRNAIPRHDPCRLRDRQTPTGRQETDGDEHPMESSEDNNPYPYE
jgi:hypothetical protein